MSSTRVPMTALTGLPEPDRSRWQPVRAGILNLFRYDEQTFVFHRGRLLIRGNNGSGKSMALEVLLPFVLDADMTPSRLSTFGGNNRNMYLWLLGFDKTGTRTSERAYVWVEFGRKLLDGSCEYFTAGAMLEGTRTSDVKATYFTTAARIGVDISVGGPGREPLNKNLLTALLAEQAAAGRLGAVHPDGKTHRKAINETLFGLPDKRFDALRRTLLQLRRPKLSDKLDEAELDRVLRDSLPPVADATVADLAEGFERLDRHAAAVTGMETTIGYLGSLRETYRRYARVAVAARADAVAAAETGIEQVRDRTTAAQKELARADGELQRVETRRGEITRRTAEIRGRRAALEDTEAFRQGQDLEPLRLLVDELTGVAARAGEQHRRTEARAARVSAAADRAATRAAQATAAADDARSVAAAAAVPARTGDVDAALATALAELQTHDSDDPSADVTAAARLLDELTERLRPWADQVGSMLRLHETAVGRWRAVGAAHAEVERAEADVVDAEEQLNDALEEDRAAMLAWLQALTAWAEHADQLRAGQAPPLPWEADTAGDRAERWATEAAATRTRALLAEQRTLRDAAQLRREAAAAATRLADELDRLVGLTQRAHDTDAERAAEAARYRATLTAWAAALVELPAAGTAPEWTQTGDDILAATARDWATGAAAARAEAIHRERAGVDGELGPQRELAETLAARETYLAGGGLPELDVPATRTADRTGRPGAPLYLLVEFADGVDTATRLGVEAATVASGLADAWVSPDGGLLTADGNPLRDTQLSLIEPPVPGPSLADVLVPAGPIPAADPTGPDTDLPVPAPVVTALLQRIALAPTAGPAGEADGPADGALVLGRDGSWRAGPLSGAHQVADVRLLGAAAREADRLAALAAVRAELAAVRADIDLLTGRRQSLTDGLTLVETERRSVPGDGSLQAATRAAATAAATATDRARACLDLLPAGTAGLPALPDAAAGHLPEGGAAVAATELQQTTLAALHAVAGSPATAGLADLHTHAATARELAAAREEAAGTLTAAADARNGHLEAVGAERAAMPADTDVRAARTALAGAGAALAAAGKRLQGRQDDEQKARDAADLADQALHAALLGAALPAGTDVPALSTAVETYRGTTRAWLRAGADAVRTTGDATQALRESVDADDEAAAARDAAKDAEAKRLENAERLRTLTEDYGEDYVVIVEELKTLKGEHDDLERELGPLGDTERTEIAAKATAKAALATTETERAEAEAARVAAQEAFLAAARIGLHAAAGLPETTPAADGRTGETDGDTVEPGLGVRAVRTWARAVRDAAGDRLARDREAVETAANRVTEKRHELEPFLAGGGVSIRDELRDGLLVLHAGSGVRSLPLVEMIDALGGDLDQARTLLAAEEADLFRKFLAEDTRREVTSRIRDARTQVAEMARLMAAHPTGSGLRVQLRWVPDERNAPGMQEIVKLMGKDAPLDSEKEALSEFFRARVAQVRANADTDYTAQLAELLDYRQWWRFVVEYKRGTDTDWTPLTGKAHGSLSGGEKAVCLHLPLFAAAASYCDNAPLRAAEPGGGTSPGAPRLILLDEVFAGVDEDNRGELFDLIRDLDLDLVATSESEKGLYPQIDGLSIYQLYASDTAVLAARSIWDGHTQHDLLEEDLLANLGDPQDLLL